ncbi:inhibitor of growth protein 4-like protein [Cladochytrium replicatum]|nr:inhibitor of growth protein 4-like protein [Cladochytrium replicatum]
MLYLEDYLDVVEALPLELQRNFSLMRELDAAAQDTIRQVEEQTTEFMEKVADLNPEEHADRLSKLAETFKETLKHGEDKVSLAMQTYDMVDRHIRRLDDDIQKFQEEQMTGPRLSSEKKRQREPSTQKYISGPKMKKSGERTTASQIIASAASSSVLPIDAAAGAAALVSAAGSAISVFGGNDGSTPTGTPRKDRMRQNGRGPRITSSSNQKGDIKGKGGMGLDMAVDPSEPTYCICNQVSYGEMIACDDDECVGQWFHYTCVGLTGQVKGKWYCPDCTAKRASGRR